MKQVILHIGGGKCGSTSIQRFLTYNNTLESADGKKYVYCVIQADGSIIHGEVMDDLVKRYDPIAFTSVPVPIYKKEAELFRRGLLEAVAMADENTVPILSSEAWGEWHSYFKEMEIFAGLDDVQFQIMLFVRPQIGWFNSAWWQWGAWSNDSLDEWVRKAGTTCDWYSIATHWEKLPPHAQVHVYDTATNAIDTLCRFMNVERDDSLDTNVAVNLSPPQALLEFFQRNRDYRQHEHDAGIELLLKQKIAFRGRRAPFALTLDQQKFVYERTVEGNQKLAHYFDPLGRERFLASIKWFSPHFLEEGEKTGASQRDVDLLIGDIINGFVAAANSERDLKYAVAQHNTVVAQMQAEHDATIAQRDELAAALAARTAEFEELQGGYAALTAQCETLAAERGGLAAQVEALVAERGTLAAQVEALASERGNLVAQIEALAAERGTLAAQVEALVAERDGLAVQVETLAAESAPLKACLDTLRLERARLEDDFHALRKEMSDILASRLWRVTRPFRRNANGRVPGPPHA